MVYLFLIDRDFEQEEREFSYFRLLVSVFPAFWLVTPLIRFEYLVELLIDY